MPLTRSISHATLIDLFDSGPVYAAVFTSNPSTSDGLTTGHEPSDPTYLRPAVSWMPPAFARIESNNAILWPTATIQWGSVLAIGLCDSVNDPTFIWFDYLSASLVVSAGQTFKINVIRITLN